MSDEKPSGDSSRRHFLSAAAVVSAAVAAPTAAKAQTVTVAKPPGGIKKTKGGIEITVPEFAMPPDAVPGIAQVIVDAWQDKPSLNKITERIQSGPNKGMATQAAVDQATAAINAAAPNFNLQRAVIITEDEHDDGYTMETVNDVVFVLPKKERAVLTGANLLNTAKLLMACTPNGI